MKRLRRYLPLLALLLFLGSVMSCRDAGVRDALQRAEALMESDPHAARAVLDSLDLQSSSPISNSSFLIPNYSRRDFADWAWLKVQTDYKCDVPLTTDSLARIATDYYGTPRRPDYHAAMAWYTLGCVYKEMSDDVNGTDAFLKAKSLFPDTLIRYYALTEQNLGLHYLHRFMYNDATQELERAKHNFIRLADSTAVAFIDLRLAQSQLFRHNHAAAKKGFEHVLENSHAREYVVKDTYFELAKLETYDNHNYAKAHELLDYSILHAQNNKKLAGVYNLKAVVFQKQKQYDSAWYYYNQSLACNIDIASFAYDFSQMASLAPSMGKTDSIEEFVRLHDKYVDSLYAISNHQAIRQVMNDHRVEMEQQRLEESHRRLLWKLSLIGLAFVITVLGVLV